RMHRRMALVALLAGLVGLWAQPVRADIKPHALFSEGMVLQQGMKAPVWGTGDPYNSATVKFQGREFKPTEAGDKSGNWKVVLDDLKPGGPYEMTITGYDDLDKKKPLNTITIKDVYVGEVWICSGQSNMEWSVNASADADRNKAASRNPKIRLFKVPH